MHLLFTIVCFFNNIFIAILYFVLYFLIISQWVIFWHFHTIGFFVVFITLSYICLILIHFLLSCRCHMLLCCFRCRNLRLNSCYHLLLVLIITTGPVMLIIMAYTNYRAMLSTPHSSPPPRRARLLPHPELQSPIFYDTAYNMVACRVSETRNGAPGGSPVPLKK